MRGERVNYFCLRAMRWLIVFRNDRAAHRRLGTVALVLAPLVVLTALQAIFGIVENAPG